MIASKGLLASRQGHTEMSVYLTQIAGLTPVTAICEMMDAETYSALSVDKAEKFGKQNGIPLIDGKELLEYAEVKLIMNIAIVVSEFNEEITSRMLDVAKEKANLLQLKIPCLHGSGAYDMPIIVDKLLQNENIDGVATLGAIIKGQTKHDEIISHATAQSLTRLSLKYQKPVSLGISGPGMEERHAYARIRPVAERAIEALVKISIELEKI